MSLTKRLRDENAFSRETNALESNRVTILKCLEAEYQGKRQRIFHHSPPLFREALVCEIFRV